MLRTAFTKTLVFSANDFSLVMFGIILFIFWFMATLYLENKLFNVLLILSYTFERNKIVREWRFFGVLVFRLDSRGVRYTFSVIIPLRIVRFPLETVDSFEIESYYSRLGQTDGRALAIKRNDGKKTTLVFGFMSIDYQIHELEWLKQNGNQVLKELKLEN